MNRIKNMLPLLLLSDTFNFFFNNPFKTYLELQVEKTHSIMVLNPINHGSKLLNKPPPKIKYAVIPSQLLTKNATVT